MQTACVLLIISMCCSHAILLTEAKTSSSVAAGGGGAVAIQLNTYLGTGCAGTASAMWGSNNSCQVHGDGSGATQYYCSSQGSVVLTWYQSKDCSGNSQGTQSFGPGQCWNPTVNARDSTSGKLLVRSMDALRAKEPFAGSVLQKSGGNGDGNNQSYSFYCVPPSVVPAVYPTISPNIALTWFTTPDCSWDGFVEQHTLSLGQCSPFVQNDGGFYHPMFFNVTSCQPGGSVELTSFADPACTVPVGSISAPAYCSQMSAGNGFYGQINCKLV